MGTGSGMSDIEWIILAVVLVLLIAAAIVLALRAKKKRELAQQQQRAHELRHEAETQHAGGLSVAQREAQEAEAKAQLARAEAERAEAERLRAEEGLAQQEARREDTLREADRLDPDVDHRADDYTPGTTGTTGAPPVADPETPPHAEGTHRRDV